MGNAFEDAARAAAQMNQIVEQQNRVLADTIGPIQRLADEQSRILADAFRFDGILANTAWFDELVADTNRHVQETLNCIAPILEQATADAAIVQELQAPQLPATGYDFLAAPDPKEKRIAALEEEVAGLREIMVEAVGLLRQLAWLAENGPKSIELRARIARQNGQMDQVIDLPVED